MLITTNKNYYKIRNWTTSFINWLIFVIKIKFSLFNIQYNSIRIILFFSSKKNTPPIKSRYTYRRKKTLSPEISSGFVANRTIVDIFHVDSLIVSSVILNVCNEKTEVTKRAFVGLWFLSASVQFSRHGHRNIRNFASFSSRISYKIILPRNDSRFESEISLYPKKKWYNIAEIDRVGWIFFETNWLKFSPFMDALR